MPLAFIDHDRDGEALVDADNGLSLSYRELGERVSMRARDLAGDRGLVFFLSTNSLDAVIDYLAAHTAGHAVAVLDGGMDPDFLSGLVDAYRPDLIVGRFPADSPAGYRQAADQVLAVESRGPEPHPDLTLLLPTSGSTGSPKMVRLSSTNVESNARAIATSLRQDSSSRPISSLPLHYSYGMSVLHSHLAVGGTVVLTNASVIEPGFWKAVDAHRITSIAGVPYTFQILRRLKFDPATHPTLVQLTQAGGRMDTTLMEHFLPTFEAAGVGLYVMYGQTEAAPRISCLPAERLKDKLGSVGLPLEGGTLSINEKGSVGTPGESGEVLYTGPNVMMGYAETRDDLALGDVQGNTLSTGDLGYLDEEGYLFLTGRLKRIAKVYGVRINLDEVERLAARLGDVAAVAGEDKIHLCHRNEDDEIATSVKRELSKEMHVAAASIKLHRVDEFPTLANGKFDYRTLTERFGG